MSIIRVIGRTIRAGSISTLYRGFGKVTVEEVEKGRYCLEERLCAL